uniref:Tyrosine aminotransferase n=1 Tax=Macrostomum lignano TaxID=282301 RepID=A0A1I8HPT6_9PLAT
MRKTSEVAIQQQQQQQKMSLKRKSMLAQNPANDIDGRIVPAPKEPRTNGSAANFKKPLIRVREQWHCPMSRMAQCTSNPIRKIVDQMKLTPNPEKKMIALSIGDPTIFGNLSPPEQLLDLVDKRLRNGKCNGYAPSVGYEPARTAVAKYSVCEGYQNLEAKDVILTSGCSSALDLCISVLANPGDNILIPRPGFSIYRTLAESLGIEARSYNLLADRQWEVDLAHLEESIDDRTAAIVVNNPSNPCGSVYTREHLRAIAHIAERYKVPIIADEIYAHFVFPGHEFHWFASVNPNVPVLSCGGLTKRWLVPGWRQGWIVIYDAKGHFAEVRKGLLALSTRILGPNTVCQAAIPDILEFTPPEFYASTLKCIEENAKLSYAKLSAVPGLRPVMPEGAMYMMMAFTERLVTEQSVFCLPSRCFEIGMFFRIVLTVPSDMMTEACDRIAQFCAAHHRPTGSSEV